MRSCSAIGHSKKPKASSIVRLPGSRTDHEGLGPGPMHRGESLIRRTDTTWLQPCVVRGRPAPGPDPAEAARDARVGHRTQRKACTEVSVSTTATDSPALVSTRTTSVAVEIGRAHV